MDNGKGRLLVVGGAQPNLKSLSQYLGEAGHAASVAERGPWTPARFASEPPELLLLDLRTPDLDAAHFVAQVRADEALHDTPIILLAAADDLAGVERCLAAGAEDYLLAPISPTLLKTQVDEYLAISRRRQEVRDRAQRETFLKMETDLQVAHRIQEGFLPKTLPQPAGWEVAANFKPRREVAGDFYDAFMLSQNRRLGFVIADVVDKGVPAALVHGAGPQPDPGLRTAELLVELDQRPRR